ncbi:hypothetical protein [Actinosynnema sp. NPDC023587]|uniref:hypothetical protein n=1 Tax=Actinosynnema sp. NPDC023587 TaxID=3154695 RepID=UPI00340AA3CA
MIAGRVTGAVAAVGTALAVALAGPGVAAAAEGTFYVNEVPRFVDPDDYKCYALSWSDDDLLDNQTNRFAYVYRNRGCHRNDLVVVLLPSGSGSVDNSAQGSVQFRKQ